MEGEACSGSFFRRCMPYIAMILLQFGYAGMIIIAKVSLNQGMNHYVLVVYKHVFATAAIAPFAFVIEREVRPKIAFLTFMQMFTLGLLGPVIDQNLYFAGLKFTTPTYACAISNLLPAMTFVMAAIFRMEKLDIRKLRCQAKVIGTVVMVAGAILMALYKGQVINFFWSKNMHHPKTHVPENTNDSSEKDWVKGSILVMISTFSWACFFILQCEKGKDLWICPIYYDVDPSEVRHQTGAFGVALAKHEQIRSKEKVQKWRLALRQAADLSGWHFIQQGFVSGTSAVVTFVVEHKFSVWSIGWDMNLLSAAYAGIVCSGIAYYVQGVVMQRKGPVFVTAFNPLLMLIVVIMDSFIFAGNIYLGGTIPESMWMIITQQLSTLRTFITRKTKGLFVWTYSDFNEELLSVIPNAHYYRRGTYDLKKIVEYAKNKDFISIIVVHTNRREPAHGLEITYHKSSLVGIRTNEGELLEMVEFKFLATNLSHNTYTMEFLFFSTELIFLLLSLLLFLYLYLHSHTQKHNKGFKIYPLVGALPDFLINRHRFLEWTTHVLRDCPTNTSVFFRPGKVHGIITANPDNVEHMLKTNFENYPKGERFISLLQDFLGRGIFNSDGELWKVQRKTASYEFNTKSLRNFVMENVTVHLDTRLLPIFSKASETDNILDLQDLLERFSFDNICKLAFNVDPDCLRGDSTTGAEFMKAFEDAALMSSGRFMCILPIWFKIKKLLNFGTERRLRESINTVHAFADKIIKFRMEAKDPNNHNQDLLSRFIGTPDASPEFLRDIVISFILAGRDTTSSALSWLFWILSSRPNVQKKILDEIETVRSRRSGELSRAKFAYEELKEMHYLHAAISETMRLYPPVPVDTKECLYDDVLPDGTVIKKDWFLTYHTYAMGRMENVWGKDCCEFKPERWLENGVYCAESPFRFPVFHAGPRMCLGKDMAYIQMKSIAACVMERFEIEAVDKDTCPEHLLSLTLRMKGGLPVKVRARTTRDATCAATASVFT
ncbi:hypothetical protein RIF29_05390 [Crotalaria pallida]|uniref:Cytochrome P450 n=1 Tax=Crotalaria pallida TaxID=3830 RepID=A0AAN9J303_CROPI